MTEFDDFYAAHYADVVVQIYAYFGDRQEAQDVVQEAFCRALARWARLAATDDPVAWVRRVAWNLATSHWRRTRTILRFLRHQREESVVEGPDPDRIALLCALATLPPVQRRAMVLRYLVDLPIGEIAAREGVAEATVRSWLHRGRSALAVHLTTEGHRAWTTSPNSPKRRPGPPSSRYATRRSLRCARPEQSPRGARCAAKDGPVTSMAAGLAVAGIAVLGVAAGGALKTGRAPVASIATAANDQQPVAASTSTTGEKLYAVARDELTDPFETWMIPAEPGTYRFTLFCSGTGGGWVALTAGSRSATAPVTCSDPPTGSSVELTVATREKLALRVDWDPGTKLRDTPEGWAVKLLGN